VVKHVGLLGTVSVSYLQVYKLNFRVTLLSFVLVGFYTPEELSHKLRL